ncbi:MAG: hybrid sensor histidine kinase/response regulator [Chloroflexota bacterium]
MQFHILIVDDDPLVRDVLTRMIRQMNYTVLEANSGSEALRLLADPSTPPIDLLLTDIMMPRMSGIDLLKNLRQTHPDLPVAMITGAATLDNCIAALNAGAYAYLLKPMRGDEVREVVTKGLQVLEQSRSRQMLESKFKDRYQALENQLTMLQESQQQAALGVSAEALDGLIRGLRHELGNATTAIKLNLSVMEYDRSDPDALHEHLQDLESSTDELVALLTRLKQYPTAGAISELVDLRQSLTALVDSATQKFANQPIQLNLVLPEESVLVHGRDMELMSMCIHILDNAVEATIDAGGKQVTIALKVSDESATVTFSDEGSGFPAEMLDEIFSPGYTTKMRSGFMRGLGLGLFVARATVNLYRGRIWLENRPEGGANVHIRLPLASYEDASRAHSTMPFAD